MSSLHKSLMYRYIHHYWVNVVYISMYTHIQVHKTYLVQMTFAFNLFSCEVVFFITWFSRSLLNWSSTYVFTYKFTYPSVCMYNITSQVNYWRIKWDLFVWVCPPLNEAVLTVHTLTDQGHGILPMLWICIIWTTQDFFLKIYPILYTLSQPKWQVLYIRT